MGHRIRWPWRYSATMRICPTMASVNSGSSSAGIQYSRWRATADLVGLVFADVIGSDGELGYEADVGVVGICCVPFARDLLGVLEAEEGVEDRLLGQSWGEGSVAALLDEAKFVAVDGSP